MSGYKIAYILVYHGNFNQLLLESLPFLEAMLILPACAGWFFHQLVSVRNAISQELFAAAAELAKRETWMKFGRSNHCSHRLSWLVVTGSHRSVLRSQLVFSLLHSETSSFFLTVELTDQQQLQCHHHFLGWLFKKAGVSHRLLCLVHFHDLFLTSGYVQFFRLITCLFFSATSFLFWVFITPALSTIV